MLEPSIQNRPAGVDIDEAARERGLACLRKLNFAKLSVRVNELVAAGSSRPRMLDVGCAHGWFIEVNQGAYDVVGIEPDMAVASATQARGIPIRVGFFPDVVGNNERFDVIVFNDVLEHIPDINGVLAACWKHLSPKGIVVVNAPCRRGVLYVIAQVMARIGAPASFDRLWQKDLPSPHVHYLDTASVNRMASRNGFRLESKMALPSVAIAGLFSRIRSAGQVGVLKSVALAIAIALASPVIRALPSDIEVWFLRKAEASR